jgi:hypothetical protein
MKFVLKIFGFEKLGEYLDYLIDSMIVSRLDLAVDASDEAADIDSKLEQDVYAI